MNNEFMAQEALEMVLARYPVRTVLDIGCGQGLHSEVFRRCLKTVVGVDAGSHWGQPELSGDFVELRFDEPFDLVWCSHVLEHQPNVQRFLRKAYAALKPGGVLAVTVPPAKHQIVGGHVSLWNAGLLLYNLILAGFDCREALLKQYGYNISVLVRKSHATLPPLRMDAGDIEVLAPYFPFPVRQGFDGNLMEHGWDATPDPRPVAGRVLESHELDLGRFRELPDCFADDRAHLAWSLACAERPGDVAELGVREGLGLRMMAAAQPHRRFHGFDAFPGGRLPQDLGGNVRLHPGAFADSVPAWRGVGRQPLALLHIDTGPFPSVRYLLDALDALIVPGTVLVLGQICDWRGSGVPACREEGAWRALGEWMRARDRAVRPLSRGPHASASVVVAR